MDLHVQSPATEEHLSKALWTPAWDHFHQKRFLLRPFPLPDQVVVSCKLQAESIPVTYQVEAVDYEVIWWSDAKQIYHLNLLRACDKKESLWGREISDCSHWNQQIKIFVFGHGMERIQENCLHPSTTGFFIISYTGQQHSQKPVDVLCDLVEVRYPPLFPMTCNNSCFH